MDNAKIVSPLTKHQEYIESIIPHRLDMVDIMQYAITEMTFKEGTRRIEILVDGKLRVKGLNTAFTYPAIEAGIINARALLDFLGLKVDPRDSTKLKERSGKKHNDELFIEDFKNGNKQLTKITIEDVKRYYPGSPEEAEGALARIIHLGNKEIAHTTLGRDISDDDITILKIAAKGVRALTVSFFFTKLGIQTPTSPVS